MVYADPGEDRASQGDVFENVQFVDFASDGMITSHSCVCDKYDKAPSDQQALFVVSVAPVHALDALTGDRRNNARAGNMPRYFYLPDERDRGELVADLWLEQPVNFAQLREQPLLTCLSPEWLGRLWTQFVRLRLGEDYMDFLKELVDAA